MSQVANIPSLADRWLAARVGLGAPEYGSVRLTVKLADLANSSAIVRTSRCEASALCTPSHDDLLLGARGFYQLRPMPGSPVVTGRPV